MKQRFIFLCLTALILLTGCANAAQSSSASAVPPASVSAHSESVPQPQASSSAQSESVPPPSSAAQSASAVKIDVDLVGMNSTMVYAQVYDMLNSPESYMGKTVRIAGAFNMYPNEELGKNYYVIMIADALACCQQGMEFVLAGEHSYPQDYPATGTALQVTGVFGSYEENGGTFYYLEAAEMTPA